jgi:Ni2+-binding GTPase involved in maturation of urease and hydrogenase
MDLHLIGGFLGSGKTTAIIGATKRLLAQGKRVGVVTNDQGRYLVDTAFFRASNVPTVEVTGGCFCCNFDDLAACLRQLNESAWPDVVFAESVGSCADIVATVVKPLLELQSAGMPPSSYSVFADARLLRRRLFGQPMPFGDDVVYIFDKQIEEAGLLVINKTDLLSAPDLQRLAELARQSWPGKAIRLQNSRREEDIAAWVELLQTDTAPVPRVSVPIDYARYGSGEAQLAWLDECVTINMQEGQARSVVISLVSAILAAIRREDLPIGHVKFMVQTAGVEAKISLPSIDEPGWETSVPVFAGTQIRLLINARVETSSDHLRVLVAETMRQAASETGSTCAESEVASFHPGFPRPTHRIA